MFSIIKKSPFDYGLFVITSSLWLIDFNLFLIDLVALRLSDNIFFKNFALRPSDSLLRIRVSSFWDSLSVLSNVASTSFFFLFSRLICSDFVLFCFFMFIKFCLVMIIVFKRKSIKSVLKFANIFIFEYNIVVDFIFYHYWIEKLLE